MAAGSTRGRCARAMTPVPGGTGASRTNSSGATAVDEVVDLLRDVGREVGGEPRQRRGIGRHRGLDHRPEAQRVLQRMKAFEHGEGRILARPPEALDQRAGPGRRKPAGQRFGTS